MADKIAGGAPKGADPTPQAKGGDHCPHCADHHARIGAIETKLGMKAEKGVAKEERRERKRH